jgi:hypothetical protein
MGAGFHRRLAIQEIELIMDPERLAALKIEIHGRD